MCILHKKKAYERKVVFGKMKIFIYERNLYITAGTKQLQVPFYKFCNKE